MSIDATTYNIIALVWSVLTLVLSIVFVIMTIIKKSKQSKHLDKTVEDTSTSEESEKLGESKFDKIYNRILGYMEAAEVGNKILADMAKNNGIPIHLGVQKLTEVLSKIKIDCMSEGIEYDESFWKDKIEELVKFSKTVNSK